MAKPIEALSNTEKTTVRGHLKAVGSDTTAIDPLVSGSAIQILNTVALTTAQYNELVVANAVVATTEYIITDAPASQPLSSVLTATTASFTTADEAKLDGIAAGATAAGATGDTYASSHEADTTAHTAANIVNTPAGSIAATTVQAAINELATEKAPLANPSFTGTVTSVGQIRTTGNGARIFTIADDADISTSGDGAKIFTEGIGADIFTTGANSHIYAEGAGANIETTFGQFIGAGTGLTGTAVNLVAGAALTILRTTAQGAPTHPTVPILAIGQQCRAGDAAPYTWYRAETLTKWTREDALPLTDYQIVSAEGRRLIAALKATGTLYSVGCFFATNKASSGGLSAAGTSTHVQLMNANGTFGTPVANNGVLGFPTGLGHQAYGVRACDGTGASVGAAGITYVDLNSESLTALDVVGSTALTRLSCSNNRLTELDVVSNTVLNELDCANNQLTALNVATNAALTYLDCRGNDIILLNVAANTALTYLDCRGNQLTALSVTTNAALTSVHCSSNQLSLAAHDALFTSVPAGMVDNVGFWDSSLNLASPSSVSTAKIAAMDVTWTLAY